MYKFIEKKLLYKSSVLADILVGFSIILAGYFYYYENKKIVSNIENSLNVNYAIKIALAIIIIIVWMTLSFQNGIKKRHSFLICTLFLWIVPQIIKYIIDIFDSGVYSTSLQRSFILLAKYLSGINYLSLKTFGDIIFKVSGIPYYITLNSMIILFEAMFITGFAVAEHFNIKEDIEVNETLHKIKTIKENGEQAT